MTTAYPRNFPGRPAMGRGRLEMTMSDHFKPFCFDHPIHFDGCPGCAEAVRRAAVLATGSPATYVEGREAPRREGACGADGEHGGYCDLPAQHEGVPHMTNPAARAYMDLAASKAPDLEACARAAYVASWRNSPTVLPWEAISEDDRERGREVARAVLAAAGRGGR